MDQLNETGRIIARLVEGLRPHVEELRQHPHLLEVALQGLGLPVAHVEDAREALESAQGCLRALMRSVPVELAELVTALEERPTGGELPEAGCLRSLRALEVLTRALGHLEGANTYLSPEVVS
jgi:hypothetical protein